MYVGCVYVCGVCNKCMSCVCMCGVCNEGRKASGRRPPAGTPGTGDVRLQKVMVVEMEWRRL